MRMTVREFDIGTYIVSSETVDQKEYLVDINAYAGNGECSCEDFTYNKRKIIEATGVIVKYREPETTRCKHIHECLTEFADTVLNRVHGRA
jgi:hypothetical protein